LLVLVHLADIPLSAIEARGQRLDQDASIDELASSLRRNGQFFPIRLREHPRKARKYEVIYGHRRLAAATKLGWNTIMADVVSASEEEALIMSISENIDRKDLTDYEKALLLDKLKNITGKTYVELGQFVNRSEPYVAQHLAMLRLFPDGIASTEEVSQLLQQLTERHARALSKIEDPFERLYSARLAVKANLGVRELEKICHAHGKDKVSRAGQRDRDEIMSILSEMVSGLNSKDLTRFFHRVSDQYFSMFSRFPPFDKMNREDSLDYLSNVLKGMDDYKVKLKDIDIKVFGNFAYSTFYELHKITIRDKSTTTKSRATVIFAKQGGVWNIVHEHWSTANPSEFLNMLDNVGSREIITAPAQQALLSIKRPTNQSSRSSSASL
jgi:ParB/RepB/Spo0J family partition protein